MSRLAMLEAWESPRLRFSDFMPNEVGLVKALFEQNVTLQAVDPTFRVWSEDVYADLLAKAQQNKEAGKPAFYLKKISIKGSAGQTLNEDKSPIGYLQLETHTPKQGMFWIPMLCLLPDYQGQGYGHEVVTSMIKTVCQSDDFAYAGLNVYAENIPAFRFWVDCGFDQIKQVKSERALGRTYHCVSLYRSV